MKAMLLTGTGPLDRTPLIAADIPDPVPGVCHTEMDEIEGRTAPPRLPVVPGHQAIGHVEKNGEGARRFAPGERVGVAWIFAVCGRCDACRSGRENLCAHFKATGRDANGGYAELMTVKEDFAVTIPTSLPDVAAAPLLCAGAIGIRSLRLTGLRDGQPLGLTGFGASAHLVLKFASRLHPNSHVYVFSRSEGERIFARELGATWAGAIGEAPPLPLQAIIDTTPAWRPVLTSLEALAPGGRLVINAIRKEQTDRAALAELEYASQLWMEKEIKSVANVTREDVRETLALAAKMGLRPEVKEYPLAEANAALMEFRSDHRIRGAKVLRIR
jgi:propanol-preferring alcohol dehydrogenase